MVLNHIAVAIKAGSYFRNLKNNGVKTKSHFKYKVYTSIESLGFGIDLVIKAGGVKRGDRSQRGSRYQPLR